MFWLTHLSGFFCSVWSRMKSLSLTQLGRITIKLHLDRLIIGFLPFPYNNSRFFCLCFRLSLPGWKGQLTNSYILHLWTFIFWSISANIHPPYFFKFGTAAGDEKIDIKSMSGEVATINRPLSPSFVVHAYNYSRLHVSMVQHLF